MIRVQPGAKSPEKELKVQVKTVNDRVQTRAQSPRYRLGQSMIESNPGPKSPKKELKVQVRAVSDRVQPRA